MESAYRARYLSGLSGNVPHWPLKLESRRVTGSQESTKEKHPTTVRCYLPCSLSHNPSQAHFTTWSMYFLFHYFSFILLIIFLCELLNHKKSSHASLPTQLKVYKCIPNNLQTRWAAIMERYALKKSSKLGFTLRFEAFYLKTLFWGQSKDPPKWRVS